MKRNKIYMFILSALLPLLWLACSKEMPTETPTEPVAEKGSYPVSFSLAKGLKAAPRTYAQVEASQGERQVHKMTAIVFDDTSGKLVGTYPVTTTQTAENLTDTDSKLTGTFDVVQGTDGQAVNFILVANLSTADIAPTLNSLATTNGVPVADLTLADVKKLQVQKDPDGNQYGFVMLSDQPQQVSLVATTQQDVSSVIKMERLAARIDIKIGTATQNSGLKIKQVKVNHYQGDSYLYEKGGSTNHLNSGESDETFASQSPSLVDKITAYTYENSLVDDTNLEVILAMNGIELEPIQVPFTSRAIERNHIYTVTLNRDPNDITDPNPSGQPKVLFKIDVADWDLKNTYVDPADTNAPRIASVTQKESNFVNDATPVTITTSPDNTQVGVDNGANYLEVELHGNSTQSKAVVSSGATGWLSATDATTYAGMQQQFQITVQPNTDPSVRTATIEFQNMLDTNNKTVMTITQAPAPFTAPTVTKVTQKENDWTTNASPVTMNATASNTKISVDDDANYLVLDVTGGNAHSSATVTSSSLWLIVSNNGSTTPYSDEFRVQVSPNATTSARVATIEITNDSDPTKKTVVTLTQAAPTTRPKLALEYVADFNLDPSGAFNNTHQYSSNQQGYFNWNQAKQHAQNMSGYHLPSQNEWRGIFGDNYSYIRFTQNITYNNINETIEINGTTQNYQADYKNTGSNVSYAIKMKGHGEVNRTAYRYRLEGSYGGNEFRMIVDAIYLGAGSTADINTVSQPSFWTSPDVTKEFWAAGYDVSSYRGFYGYFWSATPNGSSNAWHMGFYGHNAGVYYGNPSGRFSVRLFAD